MTRVIQGEELAELIQQAVPNASLEWDDDSLWIDPSQLQPVAMFLRDDGSLNFNFLSSVSAVDYIEYFELVYHLTSLKYNYSAVIKTRVFGRDFPAVPSVVAVWPGANFQEREIWDLMGIKFDGHPNLKRIMLWEGFPGHPHRKDFEDVVKY